MFGKIKTLIKSRLFRFLQSGKCHHLDEIRKLPNVDIDSQHGINCGTLFTIDAKAKEVRFERNVSCKNYCIFLVDPNATLVIKENVFLNSYCSISCLGNIQIGENTIIGENVKMYDHNHKYDTINSSLQVHRNDYTIGSIKIGSNCWIGSNVTILKNVEIGDNVIIGANCLIYKSVPANSIVKAKTDYLIETR